MNVLPTGPLNNKRDIRTYFKDMERWKFDVAYAGYYAFPWKDTVGKLKPFYLDFAKQAHKRNIAAVMQIQSTVAFLDDIPLTEAQLYLDNTPHIYAHFSEWGLKNFFGSYASDVWLEYLQKLTKLFVQDYGYDWLVFEEPMYIVDIPGTKDRFYAVFRQRYPNVPYPTKHLETVGYVKVQELKQELQLRFYDRLTTTAKKVGAKKVGIMPWFFSPTNENTPAETFHTACSTGQMIMLPNLDFVVVRMQPDNIYADAMLNTSGEALPRLYYLESLAHTLGKPVIVVNNPTNEHPTPQESNERLIPLDYFTRCTLAITAAAPQGITRHWYGKNYEQEKSQMELYTAVNEFLPRLGYPQSAFAFVYSHRANWHTLPLKPFEVWKNYWHFARALLFDYKFPIHTFYAEAIEECLNRNPQVQVLIFDEYFPLTKAEVALVEKWWTAKPNRMLIYFGSGNGYSPNSDRKGLNPDILESPYILRLFGINPPVETKTVQGISKFIESEITDFGTDLTFTGASFTQDGFWGKELNIATPQVAKVELADKKNTEIFYIGNGYLPIVTVRTNEKKNKALFIGLSLLWERGLPPLREVIRYINNRLNLHRWVTNTSEGILWSRNKWNYLILSNLENEPGMATVQLPNYGKLWDAKERRFMLEETQRSENIQKTHVDIPAYSFRLFRYVDYSEQLIDIFGMTTITELDSQNKILSLKLMTKQPVTLILKSKPKSVTVDHKNTRPQVEQFGTLVELTIPCKPGDHEIELKWK
ncbi:MAG: hypothetical protein QME64_00620 [bacterium]|nr:hypothetical protein [bacterium]